MAETSKSNPEFPIHRWPYAPQWELDGFNFSLIPVALFRGTLKAIYNWDRTTGETLPMHPTEADHCRLVANNVALQFRAMLYCKHISPPETFWKRVQQCCRQPETAQKLSDLFIQARKAYVQNPGGCPNKVASLVDEWIAFADPTSPVTAASSEPEGKPAWHILRSKWEEMMQKGEFANCGLGFKREPSTSSNTPMSYGAASRPSGANPLNEVRVKKENNSDHALLVGLVPANPNKPLSKRKRQRSETARTSHSRSHSRSRSRSPWRKRAEEPARRQSNSPMHAAPVETQSIPVVEQNGTPSSSTNQIGNVATRIRLGKCEEKMAHHINLIHAHDFRLSGHGESLADHASKIGDLDFRVKSVESKSSGKKKAKKIQESAANLTDQLETRDSNIRAEMMKQLNEAHFPIEEEQNRLNTRLDTVSGGLALHKARIEACEKAVGEQVKKSNEQEEKRAVLESSLKKKRRTQRRQIINLSKRVTELEEKLEGDNESTVSEDEDSNDKNSSAPEPSMACLMAQIAELRNVVREESEKNAKLEAALDKMTRRHDNLEDEVLQLKTGPDASDAEWRTTIEMAHRAEVRGWGVVHRPASVAPLAAARARARALESASAIAPAPALAPAPATAAASALTPAANRYSQYLAQRHQGGRR